MAQVKQAESEAAEAICKEIRRLLEAERPREAYEVAKRGEEEHPESARLARWRHVLEPVPARLVPGPTGRSLKRELAWLREHRHEYRGRKSVV